MVLTEVLRSFSSFWKLQTARFGSPGENYPSKEPQHRGVECSMKQHSLEVLSKWFLAALIVALVVGVVVRAV